MKTTTKLFLAIIAIISFAFVSPNPTNSRKTITVVIDAGHGGKDWGANHESITEKEIVAQITKKIQALNKNENVIIHLTRDSDEFVELSQRTNLINKIKPDLVLSLHVGASANADKSGVALYIPKDNASIEKSYAYASRLSQKLVKNHNFKVSEIEKASFVILKKSEVPSLIIELGYLSNDADRKYLTDEKEQTRIAATILEFFGDME